MKAPSTLLFVPGDRPDRFDKAVASGADLVVLDLEDAVAPDLKDPARGHVVEWLSSGGRAAVRVNAVDDPAHRADVGALAPFAVPVMVPKAEHPASLATLAGGLHDDSRLLALVETASGVLAAPALATATGVDRLVLGTYDLASQLGVSPDDREAMAGARQAVVLASAAAGLAPPVDGVTGDVADDERLRDDLAYAVRMGFGGKLCVHPRQVPPSREAFRPSAEEVAWARRVVEAAEGAGAVLLDGAMVDKPVVDRARRILAAGQTQ
ncbi:HpcH/HpaI aldolase/citrate lyase family protein [Nocardioides sp. GXQ0305]|uniref:HpcH/HpaI aldolase/citrate lyase family protein n=1 Tax=Nocardioides sp. GXQ0305 TaxID=3423912 RepID=UPI003D7D871E